MFCRNRGGGEGVRVVGLASHTPQKNPQKRPWTNPVTSLPLVVSAPHEGKRTHPPPPLNAPHLSPHLMLSEMPSFPVAPRGKARFAPHVQRCTDSTIRRRLSRRLRPVARGCCHGIVAAAEVGNGDDAVEEILRVTRDRRCGRGRQ